MAVLRMPRHCGKSPPSAPDPSLASSVQKHAIASVYNRLLLSLPLKCSPIRSSELSTPLLCFLLSGHRSSSIYHQFSFGNKRLLPSPLAHKMPTRRPTNENVDAHRGLYTGSESPGFFSAHCLIYTWPFITVLLNNSLVCTFNFLTLFSIFNSSLHLPIPSHKHFQSTINDIVINTCRTIHNSIHNINMLSNGNTPCVHKTFIRQN